MFFKNNSKILMMYGLFPFIIWVSFIYAFFYKMNVRIGTLIIGILLFIIGYGVSSRNRKWVIASIIALIVFCVSSFIIGLRNDYFKLLECYIAVGMAIYYAILHFFNYKLNR